MAKSFAKKEHVLMTSGWIRMDLMRDADVVILIRRSWFVLSKNLDSNKIRGYLNLTKASLFKFPLRRHR